MKKAIAFLVVIILIHSVLFAQDKQPETKSAIGFFSAYNNDGTITILASYKAWKCEVADKKQVEGLSSGDLVEFEFYMKGDVVVIVKLVNHKLPTQEEFEKIVKKYQK